MSTRCSQLPFQIKLVTSRRLFDAILIVDSNIFVHKVEERGRAYRIKFISLEKQL